MDRRQKRILGSWLIAALGVLAILVSAAAFDIGSDDSRNAKDIGAALIPFSASDVTASINYQAKLMDNASEPLNGTYTMIFRLYDVAIGGTALDTDTHTVKVTDGLFNTHIDFNPSYFDGRELWLGITVGSDSEMMPRYELSAVPYALSLRPGAVINGSVHGPILDVMNTYGDSTLYGDWGSGIFVSTSGTYSRGVHAVTSGDNSTGVFVSTFGDDNTGVVAITSGEYSTGVSAQTSDNLSAGVRAYTSGDNSEGVYARTYGNDSFGVFACTNGDESDGVSSRTYGNNSEGISVSTSGNHSWGVNAWTRGNYSGGVYAYTSGNHSWGGYC